MRVEYRLTITATCPVDDKPDVYRMIVRATRTIKVEDILAALAAETKVPCFQEDLTQRFHRSLACEVETRGWHSGVFTVVICGRDE